MYDLDTLIPISDPYADALAVLEADDQDWFA